MNHLCQCFQDQIGRISPGFLYIGNLFGRNMGFISQLFLRQIFSFRAARSASPKAVKSSIGIIVHLNNIVSFRFDLRNNLIVPVCQHDYTDLSFVSMVIGLFSSSKVRIFRFKLWAIHHFIFLEKKKIIRYR